MAKRLTQVLGVDIGTQSMKAAAVRLGRDGAEVAGLAKGPTPVDAMDHTGIYDPVAIGTTLHGILSQAGMTGMKDVIFCIQGQSSVLVRNLEVPKMNDKELDEHMKWEVQRNIPFAESTVLSDFRVIENAALTGSDNQEVVMAVSPQSAIDTIIELLKAAHLRAAAIDVEPLAIGRILKVCHPGDLGGRKTCVVNIGDANSSINMYRDSVLSFPRTVPIGGKNLTSAISTGMSLTAEEAENKKKAEASIPTSGSGEPTQSFAPYNPFDSSGAAPAEGDAPSEPVPAPVPVPTSNLYGLMEPQLADFAAEIRRSIDYYRSRGGDVETIGLTGGGSKLKGLPAYIESSLGIPVQLLNPFAGIGVAVQPGAETYLQDDASEFTVAMGMGLHIAFD
ncbi:MAG: type IV pilus assembly protein PilM [Armatimonadota bacterium]|nr:type IV pilus assembly protein PilM [Armatimonadota bacterium]